MRTGQDGGLCRDHRGREDRIMNGLFRNESNSYILNTLTMSGGEYEKLGPDKHGGDDQ